MEGVDTWTQSYEEGRKAHLIEYQKIVAAERKLTLDKRAAVQSAEKK